MNNQSFLDSDNKLYQNKILKLVLGLLLDFIGMLSYLCPVIGESFDIIWAPISGFLLTKMYTGQVGKIAGVFGTLEELIPFTDVVPTFTLTWIYVFVIKKRPQTI